MKRRDLAQVLEVKRVEEDEWCWKGLCVARVAVGHDQHDESINDWDGLRIQVFRFKWGYIG